MTFSFSEPLTATSPLSSELTLKTKSTPGAGSGSSKTRVSGRHIKTGLADQPLTFRNKVKSSGYASSPRYSILPPTGKCLWMDFFTIVVLWNLKIFAS